MTRPFAHFQFQIIRGKLGRIGGIETSGHSGILEQVTGEPGGSELGVEGEVSRVS